VFELFSLASLGLALDVVGVIFLANSLGIRNPRRFLNEHFGVEQAQPLREVHHKIRLKAQIFTGFLFLLVGFSLGIVGDVLGGGAALPPEASRGDAVRALVLLALLVIVLSLLLRVGQDAWSRVVFRRLLGEFFREHSGWNFEKHPNTTREIGEILGVPRLEEDSTGDYAGRVRLRLGLGEATPGASGRSDDAFAPLRRLGTERRP